MVSHIGRPRYDSLQRSSTSTVRQRRAREGKWGTLQCFPIHARRRARWPSAPGRPSRDGPEIASPGRVLRALCRTSALPLMAGLLAASAIANGLAKEAGGGTPLVERFLTSPDPDPTTFRVMRHVDASSEHFGQSAWM